MYATRSIWNQMPAVRLLLPFMCGILLGIECSQLGVYTLLMAGVLTGISLAVLIYTISINSVATIYKWRNAAGVAVLLLLASLGYTITFLQTDIHSPHHIAHLDPAFTGQNLIYTGLVIEPVVVKEKTLSAVIYLRQVQKGDTVIPIEGRLLATIAKDDSLVTLNFGDQIIMSGTVQPYEPPKNPDQFDYGNYQALHHIFHHIYLRHHQWSVIASDQAGPLLALVYKVRSYFLSLIKQTVQGSDKLAVATAMMLGYRDYVTDEVTQAYSGSGVLHVLSVSGMHVAVLYYVLNLLLGWMDKRRSTEILKAILVIMTMLFYAGITGLSPPVLRSVWMFALIAIARLLDREVSMYNVLAVSCFLLLIWDPYYLADVGFQLSYIAVVGIVYLYPIFHKLFPYPSFRYPAPFGFLSKPLAYLYNFVWGLICVSIAAQVATLPVSLYYFHTFPNLFLLSNLLVIPLSNLVLISGMLLFAVSWDHWLLVHTGWIFDQSLILLNHVVFWIDSIPFSLSRGIVLTLFETLTLYLCIFLICWYRNNRSAKILLMILTTVLVLSTSFSMNSINKDKIQKLIVYNVTGKKAITFILHRKAYYDFDSALANNEMLLRYNIKENWWHCGVNAMIPIDSTNIITTTSYGKNYSLCQRKITLINKALTVDSSTILKTDVLILSADVNTSINELKQKIDFQYLVFDCSCKPKRINSWIEECNKYKLRYYNCRDKAFELDL